MTARRRVAALAPETPAAAPEREAPAALSRPARVRRALHSACVLAGLASAVLCVPALRLPHPAAPVHALAAVVVGSAVVATLLSPRRDRSAAEGTES